MSLFVEIWERVAMETVFTARNIMKLSGAFGIKASPGGGLQLALRVVVRGLQNT